MTTLILIRVCIQITCAVGSFDELFGILVLVLRSKMASSTEAEIRSLQSSLEGYKDETRTDLQRTVFKK